MADVFVPRDLIRGGSLPPICAMSGKRADGAIPMKLDRTARNWKATTVRVPLSENIFKKWSIRQSVSLKSRMFATIVGVIGVLAAIRSPVQGIAILLVAGAAWGVSLMAARGLAGLQPGLERHDEGVVLTGVHPDFAEAVESSTGYR